MVEFNFQEKNTFSRYQLSNIQTNFLKMIELGRNRTTAANRVPSDLILMRHVEKA